ncbi:MAG: DUF4279 domain-containing protein [Crocinitomicaceae bacterium]|nr:DUF4279 domain-containing protein [Crocinitomicaceae bacterium]
MAFDADVFDTELVTQELGIEPTDLMIKKNPAPKRTSWKYKLVAGKDLDLEAYLEKLLDIFEPKIDLINDLKKRLNLETRLQFVIDIDINPETSTPYIGLNKRAIRFLNLTETEVDFDVYKADTIGLLDQE